MKTLNKREQEIVQVMVDLFMKGLPETRIAKYCIDKKLTEIQLRSFLDKLCLSSNTKMDIIHAFKDIQLGKHDVVQKNGEELKVWTPLDKI